VPIVTPGTVFTGAVEVAVHPPDEVPVTVYVVVDEGFAVTVVPVVADKPVAGAHV
jgi:hypothetical protein